MNSKPNLHKMNRRQWLTVGLAGAAVLSGASLLPVWRRHGSKSPVMVLKASGYSLPLDRILYNGLTELGYSHSQVKGKRILLKPNLVEVDRNAPHVNTHPAMVRAAVEAFHRLGAASVVVAEGAGHCMDSLHVFERSGLREALAGSRTRFVDLNYEDAVFVENQYRYSRLSALAFPALLREVDWVVSMPKMKTHHWAGVTLSMKNLFGMMPGSYYGWPKNILHQAGLNECIADIALTLKPQLAIVDGVVGMEGDGPIMGDPVLSGVIVMGTDLPAVDATCARLMEIDPSRVPHLSMAKSAGFHIGEMEIAQLGEEISTLKRPFRLVREIPAQRGLRA